MALTPKQKVFVDEYLIGLNATRAYKVAYLSYKKDEAATVNDSKLLRNTRVAEYIQGCIKDREKCTEITQDQVLEELRKIASANDTDFAHIMREPVIRNSSYVMDPDTGQMQIRDVIRIIPTGGLPEGKRAAISTIRETRFGVNVKIHNGVRALELLGRHLGIFKDKVELSDGLGVEKTKLDDLLQQMRGGD